MPTLRIATRKSPLALYQSQIVAERIRQCTSQRKVELIPMSTRGDAILDRSLAAIGGKGLFLKELEEALLRNQADCAVHSLKDVPMEIDDVFCLPAILARDDPADAFVSNHCGDLTALPVAARVGTSSLRRQALLRAIRPDLEVTDLRGNINTRLVMLDEGQYAAIVLACAGLQRLGFAHRVTHRLPPHHWLPAPGQGALAVQCRQDASEVIALLSVLNEPPVQQATQAERAMSRCLGGSCQVAIGAYAIPVTDGIALSGMVGNATTGQILRADCCHASDPITLGQEVARQLLNQGAASFLKPFTPE